MRRRMGKHSWWDWRADPLATSNEEQCPRSAEERRLAIESLAERCVVVDNLCSTVTHATMRTALGQFGTVLGVKMVVNPANMRFVGAGIAEMQSKEERDEVVRELREYLFMVGAMPRPARAIPATPLLLIDHPWRRNPNVIVPKLVRKNDPRAELFRDLEHKARIAADDNELLQEFLENEEIKLEKMQEGSCQELMEKLAMIAKEQKSGAIPLVKELYGLKK